MVFPFFFILAWCVDCLHRFLAVIASFLLLLRYMTIYVVWVAISKYNAIVELIF